MKVAFWSPTPFAGRKSTHLLLMALQTIIEEGGEQLILHVDPEGSGPEHFLLAGSHRRRMMERKEFGVEFLGNLLHCERLSKEALINASYTFAEGKLHVLPAGDGLFYRGREKEAAGTICDMMRVAGELFEHVWVELPAGDSEFTRQILSSVDCVLVNLAQTPCELAKAERLPEFRKMFFLIGAYEQRNIYSVHNIQLLFPRLRGRCAVVPYCTGLLKACCEGDIDNFWMRESGGSGENSVSDLGGAVKKIYGRWKAGGSDGLCGNAKVAK